METWIEIERKMPELQKAKMHFQSSWLETNTNWQEEKSPSSPATSQVPTAVCVNSRKSCHIISLALCHLNRWRVDLRKCGNITCPRTQCEIDFPWSYQCMHRLSFLKERGDTSIKEKEQQKGKTGPSPSQHQPGRSAARKSDEQGVGFTITSQTSLCTETLTPVETEVRRSPGFPPSCVEWAIQ